MSCCAYPQLGRNTFVEATAERFSVEQDGFKVPLAVDQYPVLDISRTSHSEEGHTSVRRQCFDLSLDDDQALDVLPAFNDDAAGAVYMNALDSPEVAELLYPEYGSSQLLSCFLYYLYERSYVRERRWQFLRIFITSFYHFSHHILQFQVTSLPTDPYARGIGAAYAKTAYLQNGCDNGVERVG